MTPPSALRTPLAQRLALDLPLIVAPMAGGPTTPQLVAASSDAGALGSLGAAYLQPAELRAAVAATRRLSERPIAINLFAPMPALALDAAQVQAAVAATRGYRGELGLPEPALAPPFHPDFDGQFAEVLRARPAVFSFVFGLIDRGSLADCRREGILTMGTATTVDEGLALADSGVDAVVAQGVEAGGHRGIFDPSAADPGVGTAALTRDLVARVRVPVVAAGGVMDGRGIADLLRLGAQAVQMGTAFLLCPEAGTSAPYRAALASAGTTQLTRAFSGRWARGLPNRFLTGMAAAGPSLLPFPAQNAFTRDLRQRSAQRGSADFLSLWAGTGVAALRPGVPAGQLIRDLHGEALAAL